MRNLDNINYKNGWLAYEEGYAFTESACLDWQNGWRAAKQFWRGK